MNITPYTIKELRLKNPKELKGSLPTYPTVRKEEKEGKVSFKTLVRKRYNGIYYLVPLRFTDKDEAKCIHGLHAIVYKYLMLGQYDFLDVEDDEQINEGIRLKNL